MFRGIGVSKGIGIGVALVVSEHHMDISVHSVEDTQEEKNRFYHACDIFASETEEMAEKFTLKTGIEDKNVQIFKNQIALVRDVELTGSIEQVIDAEKINSEAAVFKVCNQYMELFTAMDNEVIQQRAADIEDVRNRLICVMTGQKKADLTKLSENTVIIARELHPSVAVSMDVQHIAGIVTERGGEASHAAILARAMGIPAVLSVRDFMSAVREDDRVIVDGDSGEVLLNPTDGDVRIYVKKKEQYEKDNNELKRFMHKKTETRDGKSVVIAANIVSANEAEKAMQNGAECVGLFRTEFLFMNRKAMPSEEEQFREYKKAALLLKGRQLTIRTLDIGGDKDIPYMGLSREQNPFLGYRAVRYCLGRPDVFKAQLRAILRASAYGNIRIMIPMVSSLSEICAVKKIVRDICGELDQKGIAYDSDIRIGTMIETPAAALIADVLARYADFFSIGTNDLTMYTIAVDRGNEKVSYLYSAFHPSVLKLIRHIIACGHEAGIEVGMCGEAAADENMIPLLLAYGLDEFSVAPGKVLKTREIISNWSMKEAEEAAGMIMHITDEKEIVNRIAGYGTNKNIKE